MIAQSRKIPSFSKSRHRLDGGCEYACGGCGRRLDGCLRWEGVGSNTTSMVWPNMTLFFEYAGESLILREIEDCGMY